RRRERRERRGAPSPDAAFSAAAASAASFLAAAASANSRDASDAAFASTRSLLTDASILTAWRMTSSQYPCWIGYRPSSSVRAPEDSTSLSCSLVANSLGPLCCWCWPRVMSFHGNDDAR